MMSLLGARMVLLVDCLEVSTTMPRLANEEVTVVVVAVADIVVAADDE